MLKKEHEILKIFIKTPWKNFTYKEIIKYTRKKSESYVFNSLKKFVNQNILLEEKAGNVVLYSLNLNSEKTLVYTGFIAEHIAWNQKRISYDDLDRLIKRIPTDFFILITTGSYASKKQTKKSDIDVAIICDDGFDPKKIYAELRNQASLNIPPIHLYTFKRIEFLRMLLDKQANYGKEIAGNNLILSGGKEYYKIIAEAMKNGFNGWNISW